MKQHTRKMVERLKPTCNVRFACPACGFEVIADAYEGPNVCTGCPKDELDHIMVPLQLVGVVRPPHPGDHARGNTQEVMPAEIHRGPGKPYEEPPSDTELWRQNEPGSMGGRGDGSNMGYPDSALEVWEPETQIRDGENGGR